MNAKQIFGALTAVKGAGLVGTFCTLDGLRILDGSPWNELIILCVAIGVVLMVVGLAMISAYEGAK
ncbi:MAG: hypothetical protein AAFY98_05975 [Verrucomicrobiota bacterium]